MKFETHRFAAKEVHSLCWYGEMLIDWVMGGYGFRMDGSIIESSRRFAYRFDSATASPDGRFAVIYERAGTKGLLLDNGNDIREINRSYYCANDYEYPVLLFQNSAGRNLLAHCPERYCQLEIEDAATGERLTASGRRNPADYFHSQISASPSGKRLLVAGWVWHPWSMVQIFDVANALADGLHLDNGSSPWPRTRYAQDEGTACWLDDDTLVIGGTEEISEVVSPLSPENGPAPVPKGLAIVNIVTGKGLRAFQYDEPPGKMFAVGKRHVLSLYRHPKLIDLETGAIVHAWPDIESGLTLDSISATLREYDPPMAFDRIRNRFAIANGGNIMVITFHPDHV